MDKMDCGLCCLAMISEYFGNYVSLFELRDIIGHGRDGISLFNLRNLAEQIGFKAVCRKMDAQQLKSIPLPSILFWDEMHFVVLEKMDKKNYYIIDPEFGRRKLDEKEFNDGFSNYTLTCLPGDSFVKNKKNKSWSPIIKLVYKTPKVSAALLITLIILQLITLAVPFFTQFIVDNIILSKLSNSTYIFGLGMIILVLSQVFFSFLRGKLVIFLENSLDIQMTTNFFKHLLQLPYKFFQLRSFGDLLYRAYSLQTIREIISNYLFKGFLDFGMAIVILFYMFQQSKHLALWTIILGGTNVLFQFLSNKKVIIRNQEEIVKISTINGIQTEMMYGISDIKTSGVEEIFYNKWYEEFKKLILTHKKKAELINIINTISIGLNMFAPLFLLYIGSNLVLSNTLSLGGLIAYNTISIQFFSLCGSIVQIVNMFNLTKTHLNRINDVTNSPIDPECNNSEIFKNIKGTIEFENVCFKYSKFGGNVIDNISFKIEKGQKVAIIGESGSGKTTLAGLLIGLNIPTSGQVKFDGISLEKLNKKQLRTNIGVVPQTATLFNKSIYENICLNKPEATYEEVVNAAKAAQIHDDIMRMPMKYHTQIAEMGMAISGGQRQRLAIARAIIHNPSILLFDEATSSLDYVNEQKIDTYFSNLNCTRIVITHRLSSILNSDTIIVLDKGKIIGQGTHHELIVFNSFYKNYYKKHLQDESLVSNS